MRIKFGLDIRLFRDKDMVYTYCKNEPEIHFYKDGKIYLCDSGSLLGSFKDCEEISNDHLRRITEDILRSVKRGERKTGRQQEKWLCE